MSQKTESPSQSQPIAQVAEIPLQSIDPSPFQPRTREITKKDVEDLMTSISANGQVQPVIVSKSGSEGRYVVHSGHRRCAALRFLGADTVRAIIRHLTDREAQRLVIGDNLGRKDLAAMEKAVAIQQYADAYDDVDYESAAAELGVKRRTAFRLKALLHASKELQEIFAKGQVPARPAAALTKLEGRDPRRARRLAEKYLAGEVTAVEIERWVKVAHKIPMAVPTLARRAADLKVTAREIRLAVNLTRTDVDLKASVVDQACAAIGEFLTHIGRDSVAATPLPAFDEVTQ